MTPGKFDSKEPPKDNSDPNQIPIDGFKQIVDMLQVADPAFRESLLKRLAARDSRLAASLRRDLVSR
jgi:hypothetical protein